MKTATMIVVMAFVLCVGSWAQAPEVQVASPEIAAPPGGTLITELNLSEADILGMIKQALPAFSQAVANASGEFGTMLQKLDLNTLAEAIAGIRQIHAMQFKLDPNVKPDVIMSFYQDQFSPEQGWNRVLYDASKGPKGAAAVYARSGQEFFGIGVDSAKQRAFAVRTVGFVDVPKLAAWSGQAIKVFSEMKPKPKPKPEAAKPPAK
ncbi:MAG: hypothetical protein HYX78_01580 [Armatimonadetes bacterium]|nr:hypothetical protein [Armatimonadota bacterium]